jgi:hypothetical protein
MFVFLFSNILVLMLEIFSFAIISFGFSPRTHYSFINKELESKNRFGTHQLKVDDHFRTDLNSESLESPAQREELDCNLSDLYQILPNDYPSATIGKSVRHHCTRKNKEPVFDIFYSIDEMGGRKVHNYPVTHKRHLLTVGCSFIFGLGLRDDQVMAHFLNEEWPETKIYNPSHVGGSVADSLIGIEYLGRWDRFEPKQGMALVFFSPYMHIPRFYPFFDQILRWNERGAAMTWSKESQSYRWKGSWMGHLWWYPFAKLLRKSWFVYATGVDTLFYKIDTTHYLGYARALRQLKQKYQAKYPESDFVVFTKPNEKIPQYFFDILDEYAINYLYYGDISEELFPAELMQIPYDGHPNEDWHWYMAQMISADLRNNHNQAILSNFFGE